MGLLFRVLSYPHKMTLFLKGVSHFHSRDFKGALPYFEKCLKHKDFKNELSLSYYGQCLCAIGRLEEGGSFLLRACNTYASRDWYFEDEHSYTLAKNTLAALRHVNEQTSITVDQSLLEKVPRLRE
jgi:tetratricopeptide (TPR) repeat protein